jgi:hypothetical protein
MILTSEATMARVPSPPAPIESPREALPSEPVQSKVPERVVATSGCVPVPSSEETRAGHPALPRTPTSEQSEKSSPSPGEQENADVVMPEKAEAQPEPVGATMEGGAKTKHQLHPAIPFLGAILLIVSVLVGLVVMKRKDPVIDPPVVESPGGIAEPQDEEARNRFLRDGWKRYSMDTLTGFLRAHSPEEKARYVLGGEGMRGEMSDFYAGTELIDESDTPIDAFNHLDLDIADKKRGLFLMQYERPAQYNMREFFRPVASLQIQHKLEDPDLLLSVFASHENFELESVRVMAFFKEVDNKLLLDWDVYAQTKYRSLRHFRENPQPGVSQDFRVMVSEELGGAGDADFSTFRTFRFSDPAHSEDRVDVPVEMAGLPGQILSDLAWINLPDRELQRRYATLKLAWSEENPPRITLQKVICWEFLGLGGVAGNADPIGEPVPLSPGGLDDLALDHLVPSAPPSIDTVDAVSSAVEAIEIIPVAIPIDEDELPEFDEEEGADFPGDIDALNP